MVHLPHSHAYLIMSPPPNNSRFAIILFIFTVIILIVQVGVFLALSLSQNENQITGRPSSSMLGARPSVDNIPVILLGFPRSGSLAIHQFFQCHGWNSAHYCCGSDTAERSATQFPCLDEAGPTCGDCVLKNLKGHRPAFTDCKKKGKEENQNNNNNNNIINHENMMIWSQFDVETADAWFLPQHFALGLLHFVEDHRLCCC